MNTASPMPDEAHPLLDELDGPLVHEPMSRIMQDERAIAIAKAHGANVIFNGEVAMSARELANTLRQVEREAIAKALKCARVPDCADDRIKGVARIIQNRIRALLNQPECNCGAAFDDGMHYASCAARAHQPEPELPVSGKCYLHYLIIPSGSACPRCPTPEQEQGNGN